MSRNRKTTKDHLEVTVPDKVERSVTGSTEKNLVESRSYLYISPRFDDSTLARDVANGAEPFAPLCNAQEYDKNSRVTVIRGKSEENVLKAVTYLAPLHNAIDGVSYGRYAEKTDAEQEEPGDYPNLIPIIPAGYLIYENGFETPQPFGATNQGYQSALKVGRRKLFFDYQKREPVIIFAHAYFFNSLTTNALDSFTGNRRIYICLVDDGRYLTELDAYDDSNDEIPEVDNSFRTVTKEQLEIILATDAAVIDLYESDEACKRYFAKILDDTAQYYGVRFEKGFNSLGFIDRVMDIMKDNRALTITRLVERTARRSVTHVIGENLFKLIGKLMEADDKSKRGWEAIESLTGCEELKKSLRHYVDSMTYAQARSLYGKKSLMPCCLEFVGNPGTGKTTVAEALAQICDEQGILKGKRFISIAAPQLQSGFLGQSAHRVAKLFAENDLIFIDEAYALAESKDSLYAREVLAQLCVEIENASKRQNKIVIFAGYGGDDSDEKANAMKRFMDANPGIKSRIGAVINFRSYDADECVAITKGIIKNEGYEISDAEWNEVEQRLHGFFETRVNNPGFGNGRECRNVVMHALRTTAARIVRGRKINEISEEELKMITGSDILDAVSEMERIEKTKNGKKTAKIGFTA